MEYWDKDKPLENLLKQSDVWIDPNVPDSDGKDAFMHLAILNEFELAKYLITLLSYNYGKTKQRESTNGHLGGQLPNERILNGVKGVGVPDVKKKSTYEDDEEEQIVTTKKELLESIKQGQKGSQKEIENGVACKVEMGKPTEVLFKVGIDIARQDNLGKSVIHYIVTPVSYGSYENTEFLEFMIKYGFKPDLIDNSGLQPYQYAIKQSTGALLDVFKDLDIVDRSLKIDEGISSFKKLEDWEETNYLKDAQDFLDLAKMNVDKETLVP
jgi:ankyrin repeat protein